ncbi:paraquat-inducible protein A [Portibacter lacus]|uniref:Paraquat-inducible protein A n=1 Tax=Portibacter lacus TaxID=1099794 RepID=A0AA37WDU5_9BACT|nr:paraquat-inducible protein A [Portibacter lacus]GLR16392.1 hypothetical protein GCM10007940_10070 [Portibacter lacus]
MSGRNIGTLALTIISIGLLIPGLILPILSIDIGAKIPILGEISLHNTQQSIVETVKNLFKNGNGLVGFLILFFSILIPFIKAILIITGIVSKNSTRKHQIQRFLGVIGKWSMADVFIVAIFIAFLSTSTDDNIHAFIHIGFYFFLAYCIISILAFQMFKIDQTEKL